MRGATGLLPSSIARISFWALCAKYPNATEGASVPMKATGPTPIANRTTRASSGAGGLKGVKAVVAPARPRYGCGNQDAT